MKRGLFLNVVIRKSTSIFQLLTSENQTLLLWRDSFLVLDLCLDVLDGVVRLDIQSDRLSREGLDEDLHGTTAKAKDKVKCGLFLDVVIRKCTSIFELLTSENQTLLLRWDSFLVLDLCLDVLNRVIRLDVQSDRLSRKGLDEDLHGTTAKAKDKMKRGLFLDVVIRKSTSIFQL